ncbi:hypothetical protein NW762_014467 [Fusarium torreyae]|uniref:Uncharacterized protein n=1 Tax=Fusarium torreyae TaxID=1237075 RepID=A0A9W8V6M3_9HYPO|nr:hypothetical protein NW762_014467 [Fusarium torreyae]
MSEAGGTIQRIIRCVETTSRFRDKQLPSLITEGLQAVDESVDIISQVKENFSEWKHLTQNVLRALEEHTSSNEMQHRNAQRKLVQTQGRAEELQQLTQKIEESREAFNEALQDYKDTYSNLRTSNSDVDPWITALVALYRSPKVIPTAIAMGDPWKMDRRLAAAQQTISFLTNRLGELEDEIQATGDVVAILNSTLGDLTKLQQQIENFLDFLLSIQKVVKVIEDSRDRVLIRNLTSEDLHELKRDPESKRDFIRDAHRIQMRFMIACKAATLYNEVSDMFIIPGVAWVGGLCFIDCSEDAYEKSLLEIQARDRQLCEGASQLIEKRVDEIGNELKTLCNMSANSPAQHVTKSVERVAVMENETLDDDMEK